MIFQCGVLEQTDSNAPYLYETTCLKQCQSLLKVPAVINTVASLVLQPLQMDSVFGSGLFILGAIQSFHCITLRYDKSIL